jgi:hypothetical protein
MLTTVAYHSYNFEETHERTDGQTETDKPAKTAYRFLASRGSSG